MKKLRSTLSIAMCLSGMLLNAQTAKTSSADSPDPVTPHDSKTQYIKEQNYLSKSALKDYRNYYGDSLKGFDEEAVKVELLSRFYYGEEFINVMAWRKRDFINRKYKIGEHVPKPPQPKQQTSGLKPVGGDNFVNTTPCVNEGFEATPPGAYPNNGGAVNGWVVESTTSNGKTLACGTPTNAPWVAGSPEFSIAATPIFGHPYIGTIPHSPLGGNNVAVLNNTTPGFVVTRLSTTFLVNSSNVLFQFAYAGSWDGSGHSCCDQPFFTINMYDCNGDPLSCSSISLTPPGALCQNGASGYSITTNNISWTNWQVKYIDLTPYIGSCVTIRITNGDCNGGAHHGSLYFDAKCGGNLICSSCTPPGGDTTTVHSPVSYCIGSGIAAITAPAGYISYSWTAPPGSPPIPASQATMQNITIPNPVIGAVYTVNLVSPSGCLFRALNTIANTTVSIAGIATAPSCAGGASGSATVIGNGSGSGYTYTWTSSGNSVVGTSSVATGLAPGTYTIRISGQGFAGCGTASTTVNIDVTPPGVQNILKPYCGNTVYLVTGGGTNSQWYGPNLAPVSHSLGGTSPSLTIHNPVSGDIYTLKYISIQGCNDSIRFTLSAANPGFVTATTTSVCAGSSNGSSNIFLSPTPGSPPGMNFFYISSIGTTPSYSMTTAPGSANTLSLTGLAAGTYSIRAFDGSCYYDQTFSIHTFTFDYNLSPQLVTLCSGNPTSANITFAVPPPLNHYSYAWGPTTNLVGHDKDHAIITPTVAIGTQSMIVYSATVTPAAINCPLVKSVSITVINPPIPTITAIPNLCNNSSTFQIIASPPGGNFITGLSGTNNPIFSPGGALDPSKANIGVNTFTYIFSQSNCSAQTTATYHVSQFWPATLTSTVPPLCITNAPFNLMNIVQNTQVGSWKGITLPASVDNNNHFLPAGLSTGNYVVSYMTNSTPNPTVCPASTTLNISVTHTSLPNITPAPEFCTNKSPFTMTVSPSGGGWIPLTGLSNSGSVTPSVINANSLVATYTVMDGPCLNSNTTTLNISRFIPATLTGVVGSLCYNSPPFNLLSITQHTTGSWLENTPGVMTNSFFPANLTSSVYVATYSTSSTPNANLCPDTRTIAISVLNPAQPQILQTGPYCNNASALQLSVSPKTGQWVATPYITTTGLFSPNRSILGDNLVQYAIGTSTCNRSDSKYISVEAFVPATITSAIPDLCDNSPLLNLSPFTLYGQGVWSGAGISGSNFDPSGTGAGNFILTYKTKSSPSGLCPDESAVAVNVYSLATPAITKLGPFCNNSLPVQIEVSPVGGLFGGPDVGIVSLSGKFHPGLAHIGNNLVNYSITSGPCRAYAQTIITVEKFISADFATPPVAFCSNDLPVNMNSFVQNPGGTWSQGNGMNGSNFNPAMANIGSVNTLTYYTYSHPTASLCPDQGTLAIEVRAKPRSQAFASRYEGCAPVEIFFNTPSSVGQGLWSFSDGNSATKELSATRMFMAPGEYTVQFDYTDDLGCKADPLVLQTIRVHEIPRADFSVDGDIYISDPVAQLTNLSSILGDNTYQWNISGLPELRTEVNPLVTFPEIGHYRVTLAATSLKGCKHEITKLIEVKNNFNVFIPNSFSPNYDGLNDYFMPVFSKEGIDMNSFEMEIFDRWGQSLFHTRDASSKGWNGSVRNKGEAVKQDVYVYKIRYKDMEGRSYEKIGDIKIIK
jgi:gliding motility-associated-like protein